MDSGGYGGGGVCEKSFFGESGIVWGFSGLPFGGMNGFSWDNIRVYVVSSR
jgi:hypothetical protein